MTRRSQPRAVWWHRLRDYFFGPSVDVSVLSPTALFLPGLSPEAARETSLSRQRQEHPYRTGAVVDPEDEDEDDLEAEIERENYRQKDLAGVVLEEQAFQSLLASIERRYNAATEEVTKAYERKVIKTEYFRRFYDLEIERDKEVAAAEKRHRIHVEYLWEEYRTRPYP